MHLILFDHCFWMELSFLEPIMSPTVHILNYIRMCLSHHHFNLQLEHLNLKLPQKKIIMEQIESRRKGTR